MKNIGSSLEFVEGAVKVGGATKENCGNASGLSWKSSPTIVSRQVARRLLFDRLLTAYLKAHYLDAFMAVLMTTTMMIPDRLAIEITECKHMGISVLSPDVNESFVEFCCGAE